MRFRKGWREMEGWATEDIDARKFMEAFLAASDVAYLYASCWMKKNFPICSLEQTKCITVMDICIIVTLTLKVTILKNISLY